VVCLIPPITPDRPGMWLEDIYIGPHRHSPRKTKIVKKKEKKKEHTGGGVGEKGGGVGRNPGKLPGKKKKK